MAEKKNFTIENCNGTDYDTLHPETNSGQVLLDSTAQVELKLASGSTLDDAIHTITKDGVVFQVGDTLTTARTNLGDKWLLCNGDVEKETSFPDLVQFFGGNYYAFAKNTNSKYSYTTSQGFTSAVIAIDAQAQQIAMRATYGGGSTAVRRCVFANITNSQWEWKILPVSSDPFYVHDTWIIGQQFFKGILTESSRFTQLNGVTSNVDDVIYHNNRYYVHAGTHVYVYDDIAQAPIFNANIRDSAMMSVIPEGVMCPLSSSISSGVRTVKYNIITDDLAIQTGSWTYSSTGYPGGISIIYFNGYYYTKDGSGTSGYKNQLWRTNDLSVKPTVIYEFNVDYDFYLLTDNALVFNNGYYINLNGDIKQFAINPLNNHLCNLVVFNNNVYTAANDTSNDDVFVYTSDVSSSIILPTVSMANGLYTYIKAKS